MKIPYFKEDVFRVFGTSKQAGWKMLTRENSSRTRHIADIPETRGRHSIVTPRHIREMDRILETEGMEARGLTWVQLGYEVGLECSGRTIQRVMGTMNYHKCIACRKGWVSESTAKRRFEWAIVMKERYPDDKDWFSVRFSDEVHYSYGPQGKIRIIRKPGQRYCQDCLQETNESTEKDLKKKACLGCCGPQFQVRHSFIRRSGQH